MDVYPTLDAHDASKWGSNQWVDQQKAVVCMAHGQANAEICEDGEAPSLTTLHEAPIVAFNARQDPDAWQDRSGPIDTAASQAIAFAQNQRDEVRTMDKAGALAAEPGAKQQTYVNSAMGVRRLTPLEFERLQGFPDGYTDIPGGSDTARYRALGNSMAVPVISWLGRRIQACH